MPSLYVGQLVRAPKTAELIAGLFRRQIVRGELRPGDTLPPEQQLMARFGVSRPTLREAFRILETENLISVKRGSRGGARVSSPSLSVAARYLGLLLQVRRTTIADVCQARTILEPACARLLADRRTPADLADLSACLEELRGGAAAGPGLWAAPERRFHELVVQRSGNRTLGVQGAILLDLVDTHVSLAGARDAPGAPDVAGAPDAGRRDVGGYERLVALVEKRDGPGAERHWRAHLEAAGERLLGADLRNGSVVNVFG